MQLASLPWYQFIEKVSAYSGIRMDRLVQLRSNGQLTNTVLPSYAPPHRVLVPAAPVAQNDPLSPFGYPDLVDEEDIEYEEDIEDFEDEEDVELQRAVPEPPAAPAPSAPGTPVRRLPRVLFSSKTSFVAPKSGSDEYYAQLEALRQDVLSVGVNATAEQLSALKQREQALKVLGRVEAQQEAVRFSARWVDDPMSTGIAFIAPTVTQNKMLALEVLRMEFPRTLGAVTAVDLECSKDASTFFALMVASLANRGDFAGGLHPLRATDYKRYGEGFSYALVKFRYARHVPTARARERVVFDVRAIDAQHARLAARTPWCANNAGSGSAFFGATLKNSLLATPGFKPLTGFDAQRSKYGGAEQRGVFF